MRAYTRVRLSTHVCLLAAHAAMLVQRLTYVIVCDSAHSYAPTNVLNEDYIQYAHDFSAKAFPNECYLCVLCSLLLPSYSTTADDIRLSLSRTQSARPSVAHTLSWRIPISYYISQTRTHTRALELNFRSSMVLSVCAFSFVHAFECDTPHFRLCTSAGSSYIHLHVLNGL